jgi:hypothetical protein
MYFDKLMPSTSYFFPDDIIYVTQEFVTYRHLAKSALEKPNFPDLDKCHGVCEYKGHPG